MSYTKLQNNLSRKLDDCKVSKENKEILKNYFNNQKNNPSYEHHKYILDKNVNILDKNKPNHIVINELKKRLTLSNKEQKCVFEKKSKYTSDKRLYEEDLDLDEQQYLDEKQEKKEKQKIKMFIKNQELKKLKKNILVQKNECNKINKKAKKNTDFWIIISVILLIITIVILVLYIYKLQN